MLSRTNSALLAILGALLALGYLLFRADLERAARTGPRWKRRLVAAGLALLVTLGLASCNQQPPTVTCYATLPPPPPVTSELVTRLGQQAGLLDGLVARNELTSETAAMVMATIREDLAAIDDPNAVREPSDTVATGMKPAAEAARAALAAAEARLAARAGLERNADWQALQGDWREAGEIAAGKRGSYPFTQREKEQLIARLNAGTNRLDTLAAAGLLTAAEAGLLKRNVVDLLDTVNGFRPTEMEMATCYEPMMLDRPQESYERLGARIALLRQLVAGGTVHPAAVEQIIPAIETDLAQLAAGGSPRPVAPAEQARRDELRRDTEQALATLKQQLAAAR